MSLVGGIGDLKQATYEEQALSKQFQGAVQNETGGNYSVFEVVSYKEQVVAGTNYFIKVFVGGSNNCVHIGIYKPISGEAKLTGVQGHKTFLDPIVYF